MVSIWLAISAIHKCVDMLSKAWDQHLTRVCFGGYCHLVYPRVLCLWGCLASQGTNQRLVLCCCGFASVAIVPLFSASRFAQSHVSTRLAAAQHRDCALTEHCLPQLDGCSHALVGAAYAHVRVFVSNANG
jgi:hypothetical protein